MKIDWKVVSKSPGYIGIKKMYIDTVKSGRSFSSKAELYCRFQQIICRAKYHANKQNVSLEVVLNKWFSEVSCNFENSFNGYEFNKVGGNPPNGKHTEKSELKLAKNRYKNFIHPSASRRRTLAIKETIFIISSRARKKAGKPARWNPSLRARHRARRICKTSV